MSKEENIQAENLGKMTQATLITTIDNIQKQAALIPEEQTEAVKCIGMCLSVIEAYAEWVAEYKKEFNTLHTLNMQQAIKIRSLIEENKEPLIHLPD